MNNLKIIGTGLLVGLFIGILPFISTSFYDNPLELIFSLPLIPILSIVGSDGHPPLALYLSPIIYSFIGVMVGLLCSKTKRGRLLK